MEESEGLAYDDPHSSSDATITGVDSLPGPPLSSCDKSANSPPTTLRGLAPHSPGSPMEQMPPLVPAVAMPASGMDTVEVHNPQWTTCTLEAHVWASPECVKTVARDAADGGWRRL